MREYVCDICVGNNEYVVRDPHANTLCIDPSGTVLPQRNGIVAILRLFVLYSIFMTTVLLPGIKHSTSDETVLS